MPPDSPHETRSSPLDDAQVGDDTQLLLRNLDSERQYEVTVRLFDGDEVPARGTYTLSPFDVVRVALSLPGTVDRIEVALADERATGTEYLVDDGRDAPLVEVGNGLVSVTEGVF